MQAAQNKAATARGSVAPRRQQHNATASRARRRNSAMSQFSNIFAVAVRLCDEIMYVSHEILARSAFEI